MKIYRSFIVLAAAWLCSCAGYNQSSIPNTPVAVEINTDVFTWCNPGNVGSYVYIDKQGYHREDGSIFLPAPAYHYYGFGGVLLVITSSGEYAAFDRCCPHCLLPNKPVVPDSYAKQICPTCGEEFITMDGYGYPTKGITKEGLKRYNVMYYNHIIRINN